MIPLGDSPVGEFAIGVPSPIVDSSIDTYPDVEIGACCVPESDPEALDTVCAADCGARACKAAAAELAAILADEACHYTTLDVEACHLELPKLCDLQSCQVSILGRTLSDIQFILSELEKPEVFEQCQNTIRSDDGWRPCVAADCLGWPLGQGRITEMTIKADCDGVEPVLQDSPDAPEEPILCEGNVNANAGSGLSGENLGGSLVGGILTFNTPLGDRSTTVVGSSIAFRRLPCDSYPCLFVLTAAEVDVLDFDLGPLTITGLHAELVAPAVGVVRGDMTATIETGLMRMQATLSVEKHNKSLFGPKHVPVFVTNDAPVTLVIEPDNTIKIVDASFVFPFNVRTRLSTESTHCTPVEE